MSKRLGLKRKRKSADVAPNAPTKPVAFASVPFSGRRPYSVDEYWACIQSVINQTLARSSLFNDLVQLVLSYCAPPLIWSIQAFVHSPCLDSPWIRYTCSTDSREQKSWMRPRELFYHVLRYLYYDTSVSGPSNTLMSIMLHIDHWQWIMSAHPCATERYEDTETEDANTRSTLINRAASEPSQSRTYFGQENGYEITNDTVAYAKSRRKQQHFQEIETKLCRELESEASCGMTGLSLQSGGQSFDELVMGNALSSAAMDALLTGMVFSLAYSTIWQTPVLLKWLLGTSFFDATRDRSLVDGTNDRSQVVDAAVVQAVRRGHLSVLEWLVKHANSIPVCDCSRSGLNDIWNERNVESDEDGEGGTGARNRCLAFLQVDNH